MTSIGRPTVATWKSSGKRFALDSLMEMSWSEGGKDFLKVDYGLGE